MGFKTVSELSPVVYFFISYVEPSDDTASKLIIY